jgi:integrase
MTMNRDHISKLKTGKWQVDYRGDVPPVLDPRPTKAAKGKLIQARTTFNTKTEAYDFDDYVQRERRNIDLSMTPDQKIMYKQATSELQEAGITDISILDIVKNYIKHRPQVDVTKSIISCIEEFLDELKRDAEKKHNSSRTYGGYRVLRKLLDPFLLNPVTEIQQPDVARKVADHIRGIADKENREARTLHNYFTKVKRLFNWCKEKEYLKEQPLHDGLTKVKGLQKDESVRVLSPEEAKQLMYAAQATDQEYNLLPFFILHVFCGLRPVELHRITWDHIKIDTANPFVLIPSDSTARSKKARKIALKKFPATIEWFKICDRTKPLFPFAKGPDGNTDRTFYNKRDKVLVLAGLYNEDATLSQKRPFSDIGRHSCGTYLYEGGYSAADTSSRLGNSEQVFREHYQNSEKTEEEAVEFFSITPMNSDEKLVKFAG